MFVKIIQYNLNNVWFQIGMEYQIYNHNLLLLYIEATLEFYSQIVISTLKNLSLNYLVLVATWSLNGNFVSLM